MPNIKEICDDGPEPNFPSVAERRELQRKGSVGKGTADNDEIKDCDPQDNPRH